MPFYRAQIGNIRDGFDDLIEFAKDEFEATNYFNSLQTNSEKIYGIRKVNSLAELLYDYCYGYIYPGDSLEVKVENKYKEVINKFGIELLKSEFIIYELNKDLFKEIRIIQNNEGKFLENKRDEYYSDNNPEIDAAEEEMRRWDYEDPSWRISNDLD